MKICFKDDIKNNGITGQNLKLVSLAKHMQN